MSSPFSLLRAVAFGSLLLLSTGLKADDANPPYVARGLENLTVPVGTTTSKVKLKKTFGLTGVSQQIVRFSTTLGNVDVELRPDAAPLSVANFLAYVDNGAYSSSFIDRSIPGFVVQGGTDFVSEGSVKAIATNSPVINEFRLSNLRGTLALAKLPGDPNSATDAWFFNLADNSGGETSLDTQNGGFTVFGNVIGNGMVTVDSIAALTIVNAGRSFQNLPVLPSYMTGASVSLNDLVYIDSIKKIPLLPKVLGDPALLKISASNSNPGLVTATINGDKILLTYTSGATGTATITVKAKDAAKAKAKTSFLVTVQ